MNLSGSRHITRSTGILVFLFFGITAVTRSQEIDIALIRVVVDYDSVILPASFSSEGKAFKLRNDLNDLLFQVNDPGDSFEYSFYLEGYDNRWTRWRTVGFKEYTNLSRGNYLLKVKWKTPGGDMGNEDLVTFRIKPPIYLSNIFLTIYFLLIILTAWLFYKLTIYRHLIVQKRLESVIHDRTEELMIEKEKSENLLANLLPKGTADEIMLKGKAARQKFNFATVLFSDIQGFTRIAEEINPEVLIDELDKFFFHFDAVVEKYNIEKIKTIGDAYMCAGGIPTQNRTNPIEVVLAALEMQRFMSEMQEEQKKKGLIYWDIRIGIHTGTVIAGVVGQKKLSYDIWGDTVNTASRMESSGEPGKINISGVTYEYAKEFFICEYRGKMPVKYKGELDMYFVNGIRPELRESDETEPNRTFLTRMMMIRLTDLEELVFEEYEKTASDKLVFHDLKYLKNVCTQAELIGRAEKLDDERMLTLRLAALFVMTGYMDGYINFPVSSLNYLQKFTDQYGFSDELIQNSGAILEDGLKTEPETKEGEILNDAVFNYYGRVDFIQRTELLFAEQSEFTKVTNRSEWMKKEIEKVREHRFRTNTANLLRSGTSEEQAVALDKYLSGL